MSKRLLWTLIVGSVSLAVSQKAEAVYTRTPVDFAWKYAPTFASDISDQDDAFSQVIYLPFSFPYQDDIFDRVRIHTNGFVTLGRSGWFPDAPCGGCFSQQNLGPSGSTSAPDYVIAPWWADWNPGVAGNIYYGLVDQTFVVEWWLVAPFAGTANQTYTFSLQLNMDGTFRFLYMKTTGGAPWRDFGNTASIGYQGRAIARFGDSMLYTTGTGGSLSDNTAYEYRRASDNLDVSQFNLDNSVPDIVERWAPVIWADVDQSQGRCDYLTYPTFDGDFNGANNAGHAGNNAYAMPAAVHYSLVSGTTHDFIGYYFYHAVDCTGFTGGGGHDHDWEGLTIAVNRNTGTLDAVLTNTHGKQIPYRSLFDPPFLSPDALFNVEHFSDSTDEGTFAYFSMRKGSLAYDTLGAGVEANTHATWGRWHNRCVIGPQGSPSGCDDSHGGDGIVYVYGGVADQVTTVSGHPNWFTDSRVRYALRPLSDLYGYALQQSYCGESEATALYACQSEGRPWDLMNGQGGGDAGILPWAWGEWAGVSTACSDMNLIMQPGYIFNKYFMWPPGRFDPCGYTWNGFAFSTIPLCGVLPTCPSDYGPVSEEYGRQFGTCGVSNKGITGFRCAGSYCDDMYFDCTPMPSGTGSNASGGRWTSYFSEENPAQFCSTDAFGLVLNGIVDGIRATGSYSDNVSLHCAAITSGHFGNCQWTGWMSEEQGHQSFNGKFAVGAQCSGSYCDNMKFYVCNLMP